MRLLISDEIKGNENHEGNLRGRRGGGGGCRDDSVANVNVNLIYSLHRSSGRHIVGELLRLTNPRHTCNSLFALINTKK